MNFFFLKVVCFNGALRLYGLAEMVIDQYLEAVRFTSARLTIFDAET